MKVRAMMPDDSLAQMWTLECKSTGYFFITNGQFRKILHQDNGCVPSTSIVLRERNGEKNQRFYINDDRTISLGCNNELILEMLHDGNVGVVDRAKAVSADLDIYFDIEEVE
ncbi:hypothetical protein JTB14_026110 [Gonioctena quinquepunctata]|nr:hypothetical protein JTB14_026110 [Gonioctena quinquepunctata]